MNYFRICLLLLVVQNSWAEVTETYSHGPSWLQTICHRLQQIWNEGDRDLYFTGYAWHNRHTYAKEKIAQYNETAWGGGMGKSLYDEKGNLHGLYAFAFLDSHKNIEPIAGYAYFKMARLTENIRLGAGVTAFITARSDIFHNIPFPGALPMASLTYRRASLAATYIPGAKGAGNVLFLLGKWQLDV
ncbi:MULTISPECIES: lipid IV(A) palmitoyltransferase PagP [Legionella]|uniref:Phospholipid:lipid A palmitoyltransferase n=1 Tax=Legionella septentrionalis TaxID=2498109 RepID=A0A433JK39_9GAMM|nr:MULTISPECIES: lipid IV(A) palmitoyltransferase PagP [Legionella]MCP0914887.1 lipid IV(A) palmitoyltransferase PagP [Legionella sp. 27cVA30]RUQ88836.1 phospholipid:lipid A palmitoyltransferase [Legionella septentrionalis]RUR02949.1 phospholipid:lipid A palmitoyltransferase [Legionella septentrionalis]RUR11548.1 phospholipid:lipid A palmitoyltransferase [Legionella septentrionalis]RUR16813.1 phospholipid:lipid A palmitoyltransferase [Legionella septentrionalis]